MSESLITAPPEVPFSTPRLSTTREHLVRASARLWRVQSVDGRVLGHLRLVTDPLGVRYRAERLHLPTASFRLVGDFWRADDAVASLRNG
jgi:hypothetical protein